MGFKAQRRRGGFVVSFASTINYLCLRASLLFLSSHMVLSSQLFLASLHACSLVCEAGSFSNFLLSVNDNHYRCKFSSRPPFLAPVRLSR